MCFAAGSVRLVLLSASGVQMNGQLDVPSVDKACASSLFFFFFCTPEDDYSSALIFLAIALLRRRNDYL